MAASAQYVIDVAAELNAGATVAELDKLASQLADGGIHAAAFDDAMATLQRQLQSVDDAVAASNAALSEGRSEFRQLEKAVDRAAKAAERAAVKNDGVVPPQLAANLQRAQSALDAYVPQLDRLEREATDAATAQGRLRDQMGSVGRLTTRVRDKLGDATTNLSTFRGALGDVGGPLGEFGERLLFPAQALVDLRERFGTMKAAAVVAAVGIAAVAAALVAFSVAVVVAIARVGMFALKMADAARSAALAHEAFIALNPDLKNVSGTMRDLSVEFQVGADKMQSYATQLRDAGVSADEMATALRGVAIAESGMMGDQIPQFIEQIRSGKLAVDEFASNMQRDLGHIAARQMLRLEAQGQRLKTNITGLFAGLNIEPVLEGIARLVALFEEGTATGDAMRDAVTRLFAPFAQYIEPAALAVEALILGVVIGFLEMELAARKVAKALADSLGVDLSGLEELAPTLSQITEVGRMLAPVLFGIAFALGVFTLAGLALLAAPLVPTALLIAALHLVKGGLSSLAEQAVESGKEFVQGLSAPIEEFAGKVVGLGKQIMQGLANGITASTGIVVSAITGAMNSAIGAAKSALGIASPSKVFADIGENTGDSYADSVEGGAKQAQDAMAAMVTPEPALMAQPSSALASAPVATGGGTSVTISGPITINGVDGAEDMVAQFGELLTRYLTGDAAAAGGAA